MLLRAENRLQAILEGVAARIEDKTLVRAEVRPTRIKGLSSIERKARMHGWEPAAALSNCGDLIGGRVVCNNVEDVYRFRELLMESLPNLWGAVETQDFIADPNPGGYRALHVNMRIDAGKHLLDRDLVPCEVQIRSRLQDSWAELSHDDIYKQPDLPEDLRARAKDLAEVLAAADRIASDIRLRVARVTAAPGDRPDLSRVSEDGLRFVFNEVFGRSPPDYTVRQSLNLCEELGIATLEQVPEILQRQAFRERIETTYLSILRVPLTPEAAFLAALYAAGKDDNAAIEWVRKTARLEWREIEEFARREALGSLPDTIDELIESIENTQDETDIESWAEALDATSDCRVCSATVVDSYSFAESAVQHYEVPEDKGEELHQRIENALNNSGVDTGGWGDGSLCAYHNEQAARED